MHHTVPPRALNPGASWWRAVMAADAVLLLLLLNPAIALRFAEGDRVECHLEQDVWEAGTVVQQNLQQEGFTVPFLVRLDSGGMVTAPHDDDQYIRAVGLRFAAGDRVECHLDGDVWEPGTVAQLRVEFDGKIAPFHVKLDSGTYVYAPHDDDRFIRAPGSGGAPPAEQLYSARLLRFAVGSRVECNLGMYWERGTVVSINYRDPRDLSSAPAPYQIQLDSGGLVFAPEDSDSYIRREGKIRMSDPSLRFGVGDRVECHFESAGRSGWAPGRVVALHYHEPRFGEGVTQPYQIKLDADGRLIYMTSDDESSIRREPQTQSAAAAAAAATGSAARSKLAKGRVGRRASTVGIKGSSKLGGKYGSGPPRARARASPRPEPEDSLARWWATGALGARE